MFRTIVKTVLFISLILWVGQIRIKNKPISNHFVDSVASVVRLGMNQSQKWIQKAGFEMPSFMKPRNIPRLSEHEAFSSDDRKKMERLLQ